MWTVTTSSVVHYNMMRADCCFPRNTIAVPGRGQHSDREIWLLCGDQARKDWNYWILLIRLPIHNWVVSDIVPWWRHYWILESITSIPPWRLSECAMAKLNPPNDEVLVSILARFNPHIRCIEHWNQTIHACNSAAAVLFWILTCEVSSICNSTRAIRIQHDNSADNPSACRHGTSTSSTFVKQLLASM